MSPRVAGSGHHIQTCEITLARETLFVITLAVVDMSGFCRHCNEPKAHHSLRHVQDVQSGIVEIASKKTEPARFRTSASGQPEWLARETGQRKTPPSP